MNPGLLFLIILLCSVGLGLILLLSTGLEFIGKNKAIIVERLGKFYKIKTGALGFHFPFIDQVVGKYNLNIIKAHNVIDGFSIDISYKIADVKKYHYAQKDFLQEVVNLIKSLEKITPEDLQTVIFNAADETGVEVISLDISK